MVTYRVNKPFQYLLCGFFVSQGHYTKRHQPPDPKRGKVVWKIDLINDQIVKKKNRQIIQKCLQKKVF